MKNLSEIEQTFNDATALFEAKEITKEEYLNILQGLEVEKSLTLGADQMQKKQQLQSLVQNAIQVTSMLV
jgi:hypothetical protein